MYKDSITKFKTDLYGLSYVPVLDSKYESSADYIETERKINVDRNNGNGQFTDRNYCIALKEFKNIRHKAKCIVEIGVATNFERSSTHLWLSWKKYFTHYFGIDINMEKKKHHENWKPNTHCLELNSRDDEEQILNIIQSFGQKEIDVLFIDGDHSLDMMLNDWEYAKYIRKGGIIIIHDCTIHPGPNLVFDAIDEKLFEKKKYFEDLDNDWGIAVVKKL